MIAVFPSSIVHFDVRPNILSFNGMRFASEYLERKIKFMKRNLASSRAHTIAFGKYFDLKRKYVQVGECSC